MLEQQRIAELRAESEKNAINPGMVRRFLELATNLALLYQSAAKVQKRRIVEWATLNRLASGKSPYFEPSKWLLDTQNILGVLCCAADRDNSRTDVHKLAELIVSANGIAQLDRSLGYTLAHVPSPATTLKKNIIQ